VSPTDPKSARRREAIKEHREWLDANVVLYKKTLELLNDKKALREMLKTLKESLQPIIAYSPDNAPHVAVFVVAQAQTNLEAFFSDLNFLEIYEEKLETIRDLKAQVENEPDLNAATD
jgi:predicted DNA-binding protein YlxM (UPF0122 family)